MTDELPPMRRVEAREVLDGGKPSRRLPIETVAGLAGGVAGYLIWPDLSNEWLQAGLIAACAAAASLATQGVRALVTRARSAR